MRCRGPRIERSQPVSERHPDVVFGKIDTEAQQQLAGMFNMSIPTLMIVRDRVVLFSQPGALPEAPLEDLVEQAQRIDMDDVRAKIAEEQAAG